MNRARLYVGYILGFWISGIAHQEALNDLLTKTLGGCFEVFAKYCRTSPKFTLTRQTAQQPPRLFASVRQCSRTLGYSLAIRFGGAR